MSYYVDSKSARIFYQVKGEGEPLVLLMGFGADGNTWEKHLIEYHKHFKCILIDNRGVGNSDQPEGPYSTRLMAEDTFAVMQHAGLSSAHIAGISMGGAIAQELALAYPKYVRSLVLVSTWPKFNTYTRIVYENLKKIRSHCPPDVFMELLQLWIYASPYYEDGLKELKNVQNKSLINKERQTKEGFEGQIEACINHDTVDRLAEIKVPTLITAGSIDVFTPPAYSKLLHKGIKGSRYIPFSKGGHVHHWEDLKRFNSVTKKFLLEH